MKEYVHKQVCPLWAKIFENMGHCEEKETSRKTKRKLKTK